MTIIGNNLYVIDEGNKAIRKILLTSGEVITLSGYPYFTCTPVYDQGSDIEYTPTCDYQLRAISNDGTFLYLFVNTVVRKIDLSNNTVTTLAGNELSGY
ncbi:MAG TPA: hypothetical protein DHW82_01000, partial [Spirochaetia bacterium]|nr:hypothetical protein [Spirochaetia bacterium]